jgi:hypothetical protein
MFEGRSEAHKTDVKAKLINIQILPNEKVSAYYGRLMALYTELRTLGDKTITESDVYGAFLRGVKGRAEFKIAYASLRHAKLTLREAFNTLNEAETDHREQEDSEAALLAKPVSTAEKKKKEKVKGVYCNYCKGVVGHDVHSCPKVAKKEAAKKREKEKEERREQVDALIGDASGSSGLSGLHVSKNFRPGSVLWEEAGL